jgi:hypothetical protein
MDYTHLNIQNNMQIKKEIWEDPGDYPNAIAYSPLPFREVIGWIDGDVHLEWGSGKRNKEGTPTNEDILETLNEETFFSEVDITSWEIDCYKTKITENMHTHFFKASPLDWEENFVL